MTGDHEQTSDTQCAVTRSKHLTVTVLASISVNINSPPSKSPFRYNSALQEKETGQISNSDTYRILLMHIYNFKLAPVVSVCVGWGFLPALIGLRVQQTVVSMNWMTQVIPVVLLTC